MKYFRSALFSAVFAFAISSNALAVKKDVKNQEDRKISSFDIKTNASESDWQYFFGAKPNWRFSLWKYQTNLGKSLSDWHWTWRIGWIKSCSKASDIKSEHCSEVIKQGKNDKALVVRSEVVNYLSSVYSGSGNSKAVAELEGLFKDKRNQRAGKPLYIQKQIIYALKGIGGHRASKSASNLAKSHPEIANYYEKLEKVD